jgi:hypothetical protein
MTKSHQMYMCLTLSHIKLQTVYIHPYILFIILSCQIVLYMDIMKNLVFPRLFYENTNNKSNSVVPTIFLLAIL